MLAIFNKNKVETATQAISTLFFVLQKSLEAETDTSQNHDGMNGSIFVEVGLRVGNVFFKVPYLHSLLASDRSLAEVIEAATDDQILCHFDANASLIGKAEGLVVLLNSGGLDCGKFIHRFHLGDETKVATCTSLNIDAQIGIKAVNVFKPNMAGTLMYCGFAV